MTDPLSEFYNGKTLLTTGAAGFLGTFLLEVLLRCFPGIVRIYVLLRPKNGQDPMQRREEIFKKKIFDEIRKNNPELFEKVHVISGDISHPNLGISEDDMRKLCEEVTIVFHGAASISFTQPYRSICQQNAKGTDYVIDLCRKLKKLDILVYTSTAYSNCHIHPEKIEEKIYKLPCKAEKFLAELENGTDASFSELVSSLQSKWNLKWPNSYAFSKCLTENILLEKAADLPVAIVRPSIVFGAYKGIRPGYLPEGTGIADLSVGVGKGFVKVILGDEDAIFDLIPIDLVANCHIIVAWLVATARRPPLFVVHCTSGDATKLKFGRYLNDMYDMTVMHPLPKSFQEMSVVLVKNKLMYTALAFYKHYIPAAVLDLYLSYKGSKLRLVKLYRFFDRMMEQLHYFTSTSFEFQTNNFRAFSRELQPEEIELFYTDVGGKCFAEVIQPMVTGSDIYNWEYDKVSQKRRQRIVQERTMVINAVKRSILFLFVLLMYFIISKVFFS